MYNNKERILKPQWIGITSEWVLNLQCTKRGSPQRTQHVRDSIFDRDRRSRCTAERSKDQGMCVTQMMIPIHDSRLYRNHRIIINRPRCNLGDLIDKKQKNLNQRSRRSARYSYGMFGWPWTRLQNTIWLYILCGRLSEIQTARRPWTRLQIWYGKKKSHRFWWPSGLSDVHCAPIGRSSGIAPRAELSFCSVPTQHHGYDWC